MAAPMSGIPLLSRWVESPMSRLSKVITRNPSPVSPFTKDIGHMLS